MTKIRKDFVAGSVQENPLASGTTTLTMAGNLLNLPTIASPDTATLVIDPAGTDSLSGSGSEIVTVTAYTTGAGSATITRGAEGTTARPHSQNVTIIHAPTASDFNTIISSGQASILGTSSKFGTGALGGTGTYIAIGDFGNSALALVEALGSPTDVALILQSKGVGEVQLSSGGTSTAVRLNSFGGGGTTPQIGFLGTGPVGKQSVTGSRGANAALASVLTALATFGLITDNST